VGVVGIVENISHVTRAHFQNEGRDVLLLSGAAASADAETRFGSSEYAKEILGSVWGLPPALDITKEAALQKVLLDLIEKELIESAHDCSDGGVAVALAECAFKKGIGTQGEIKAQGVVPELKLFGEDATRIVISCDANNTQAIQQMAVKSGLSADKIGVTGGRNLQISIDGKKTISASVSELKQPWASALERALHVEAPEHLVPEVLQKS
jgi:phosphoribosylformylglycinamidine synthase